MKLINNEAIVKKCYTRILDHQIVSKDLLRYMKLASYRKNEYIYQQDQVLQYLYIFVDGKVKVSYSSSNGKETIFRVLEKPRVIGEMELISEAAAYTDVEVIEDTLCFLLPLRICCDKLLNDATFLRYCCFNMAEALSLSNTQFANNQSFPPISRVASYILSIQKNDTFQLDYKIIPNIIGISERHIFRIISSFMKDGIIEKKQKIYLILKIDIIERIAADTYIL